MKIKNLSTQTLFFNDFGKQIKGVSPVDRSIRLDAGASLYLVETSEVLLSAQSGDIKRFKDAGKLELNDRFTAVADDASVSIDHNFGFVPQVSIVKDPAGAADAAVIGTDVTVSHDAAYNVTTITNISGAALTFDVRIS